MRDVIQFANGGADKGFFDRLGGIVQLAVKWAQNLPCKLPIHRRTDFRPSPFSPLYEPPCFNQ